MNAFKRTLFACLTTLLVSATPFSGVTHAAGDPSNVDNKEACNLDLRFSTFVNDENAAAVKKQGGAFTVITAQSDIARFMANAERLSGQKPDFTPTVIVVSIGSANAKAALLTYFIDNCIVSQGLLSPENIPPLFEVEKPKGDEL